MQRSWQPRFFLYPIKILRNKLKDYKVTMKEGVLKKDAKLAELGHDAYIDQM